jgi:hypothetical protein
VLNANTGSGLTYQWKKDGVNVGTASSYQATATGSYTVTVTNVSNCSSTSAPVQVNASVPPIPSINTSGSTTICEGANLTLTSSSSSGNQWYNNGTAISGATASTYVVTNAGSYTVVASSGPCASLPSNPIAITVNPSPTASITPSGPLAFCSGGNVVLNANTDNGLTYQWKKDGVNIGTASSYQANASGSYTVTVTNSSNCSTTSNATQVTVNSNPATPTIVWNGTQFTTAATGVTYQWLLNGNPISGAISANYTPTAIGAYSLQVAANGCSSTSDSYTLVVTSVDPTLTLSNSCEVYPNPAQNDFVIKLFEAPEKTVDIVMINSVGKVVKTFKVKNKLNVIKTNGLSSGVYYLKISGDKFNEVKKLEIIK